MAQRLTTRAVHASLCSSRPTSEMRRMFVEAFTAIAGRPMSPTCSI